MTRSIRQRLTWVVMLAVGASLLTASGGFLAYEYFGFRQAMVHRLTKDAEIAGYHSISALVFQDAEAATKTLEGLSVYSDVLAAAIYDLDGRRFASYRRSPAADAPDPPSTAMPAGPRFGRDGLMLVQPIRFDGKPIGSVLIHASLDEMTRRAVSYAGILLVVCVGSFGVALVISSRLQRGITSPILHLAETAQAVSKDKDYTVRAVGQGTDELALLTRTFNEMLSQIQERDVALARSERYFRGLADAMPQIVWVATPDGNADYFNRRWLEYSGATSEEAAGLCWQTTLHPDDRGACADSWARACRTGDDYTVEGRLRRHADGAHRWHLGRAVAVRDSRGDIARWFGTWTDIDDHKRTAEALEHQQRELTRSNAELEQFAYVASHDLQEPLRAVAGCTQLLQRHYGGNLDARADELIRHSVEAATRMQTLITDLLAFSRVGTRGKPFAAVDCRTALSEALENLRVSIEESGARVTWDELPTVTADRTQMMQLFQNLIGNALKFRRDDPPQVHVGVVRETSDWQFSVVDNGIGFDPIYADRIFGVFQRLHTRRQYAGTGIGLALCKKIVERHGGSIRVESQPDRGSTFYFTIPHQAVPWEDHEVALQAH